MRIEMPDDYVDINFGVDFERARERLSDEAGRAFRAYLRIKQTAGAPETALRESFDAYLQARARCRALRRHDTDAIRQILESPRL